MYTIQKYTIAPSQSKENFYNLSYQSRKKYIHSSKNTDNNANIESSPETLEGLFVSTKDSHQQPDNQITENLIKKKLKTEIK